MKIKSHRASMNVNPSVVLVALAILALSACSHLSMMSSPNTDTKFGAVVMLQPDSVIEDRGVLTMDFADFIKSAQTSTANLWKNTKLPPSSGFLVFAVRAGDKVNAWLDMEPELPASVENQTIQRLRSLPGFDVIKGTIVFAVKLSINGAPETPRETPLPKEWAAVLKSKPLPADTESLVQLVWP
jgi:hypothetical protein